MDLKVMTYLLYLAVVVPLTIWVGRALRRHGEVFLVDVFGGDERLARSVNQLLVMGFYLLNFGFLSNFMASSADVETGRALMEVLSAKVGGVALVVGVVHLGNVWSLNAFRRPDVLKHLEETKLKAPLAGTCREILGGLTKHAGMTLEIAPSLGHRQEEELSEPTSIQTADRSVTVMEALVWKVPYGCEIVLEKDRLLILPSDAAAEFWEAWLAAEEKK